MAEKTYTDDEYKNMEAALAERARKKMEEQAAEEAAYIKSLREFTNSEAYKAVLAALPDVAKTYRDDDRFKAFLDCLMTGMPALTNAAGPIAVAPVPFPAPVTPPPPGSADAE